MSVFKYEMANRIDAVAEANARLSSFLEEMKVPQAVIYSANLSVEEMATNIVKYGYDDEGEHSIELSAKTGQGRIEIVIRDDGHEFDPTAAPAPESGKPVDEMKVGGLGILLVRETAESMTYKREGGGNLLTITLKIPS